MEENQQLNQKDIYVINLDQRRLMTLAGSLLLIIGFSFWFGMLFSAKMKHSSQEHAGTPTFLLDEMQDAESLKQLANDELEYLERNLPSTPPKAKPIQRNQNVESVTKTSGHYTVQVGAYSHEKDAIRVMKKLQNKGIRAQVDRGVLYYFVRAGKANRENSLVSLNQQIDKFLNVQSKIILR